jgi:hypothetical protein
VIASDLKSSPVRYPFTVYEIRYADKQVGNVSAKLPVIPAVFAGNAEDERAHGESRCRDDAAAMRRNFLERKNGGRPVLESVDRWQLAGSIMENQTDYGTGGLTACFIGTNATFPAVLRDCGTGYCLEAVLTAAILKVSLIPV